MEAPQGDLHPNPAQHSNHKPMQHMAFPDVFPRHPFPAFPAQPGMPLPAPPSMPWPPHLGPHHPMYAGYPGAPHFLPPHLLPVQMFPPHPPPGSPPHPWLPGSGPKGPQLPHSSQASSPGLWPSSAPRGQGIQLPEGCAGLLDKVELHRLHAQALLQARSSCGPQEGVFGVQVSSGDVDFGVHSLLELQHMEPSSQLTDLMQQRCFSRDISMRNTGRCPVLLTAIHCVPERPHCFLLLDDCRLAQYSASAAKGSSKGPQGPQAVQLLPGDQYSVTVVLHLSPEMLHNKEEQGVLGSFVLFTFALGEGDCAPGQPRAAVVSRRLGVALLHRSLGLSACLRVQAPTYIPQNLLGLFDLPQGSAPTLRVIPQVKAQRQPFFTCSELWSKCPPQTYLLPKYCPGTPVSFALVQGQVSAWSLAEGPRRPAARISPPPPLPMACEQQGWGPLRAAVTREAACKAAGEGVTAIIGPLLSSLSAEECAMERQASRAVHYSIRARCAVLTDSQQQYTLQDWPPPLQQQAAPAPGPPSRRYRGPRLGVHHPLLLHLEVPGLLEGKPPLVAADVVFMRLDAERSTEYQGYVLTVDQGCCLALMPESWWARCRSLTPRTAAEAAAAAAAAAEAAALSALDKAWPSLQGSKGTLRSPTWVVAAAGAGAGAGAAGAAATAGAGAGVPAAAVRASTHALPAAAARAVPHTPSSGAGGSPAPLCHVRFAFDRTPFQRMHAAILRAVVRLPQLVGAPGPLLEQQAAVQHEDEDDPFGMDPVVDLISQRDIIGRTQLNEEQRLSISMVLRGAGRVGGTPFVLFGPPGTGKTMTLVECALQLLHKRGQVDVDKLQPKTWDDIALAGAAATPRLLLCAPQNYSADLICSALAQAGITPKDMVRLHDPRRRPMEAKPEVLAFSFLDQATSMFILPDAKDLTSKQVLVCTCFAAGLLAEGTYAQSHALQNFDVVMIDEAGQATIPESLIPASLVDPRQGQLVLCGDPCQLGPVVHSVEARSKGLDQSLLESCVYKIQQQGMAHCAVDMVMLKRNYRSHARLLDLPSRMFYHSSLLPCAEDALVAPPAWEELSRKLGGEGEGEELGGYQQEGEGEGEQQEEGQPDDDAWEGAEEVEAEAAHMLFFGVMGKQFQDGDAPSFFNPIEATTLADLLQGLLYPQALQQQGSSSSSSRQGQRHRQAASRVSPEEVGVICTYRKQVHKVRLLLRERGLGAVRVGTVDDYQGQEERIVFISTVLSSTESLPQALSGAAPDLPSHSSHTGLGFWGNPKRFNVAITRCRALLVVVGHPVVLAQDPCWKELLRHCALRGLYRGAGLPVIQRMLDMQGLGLLQGGAVQHEANTDMELQAALEQIAEMALLGAGGASLMFPETLEDYDLAMDEELPSRVAL